MEIRINGREYQFSDEAAVYLFCLEWMLRHQDSKTPQRSKVA